MGAMDRKMLYVVFTLAILLLLGLSTPSGSVINGVGRPEHSSPVKYLGVRYDYGEYPTELEWKPDGSYALVRGLNGTCYMYDGNSIQNISYPFDNWPHIGRILWRPYKNEALIWGGIVSPTTLDNGTIFYVFSSPGEYSDAAWRPDGEYCLFVGRFSMLKYYNASRTDSLEFQTVHPLAGLHLENLAWKPDGSEALMTSDGYVFLFKDDNVIEIGTNVTIGHHFNDIAWRPDGSEAILVGDKGVVIRYKDGVLERLRAPVNPDFPVESVSWSPDGKHCLMISGSGWRDHGMLLTEYGNSGIVNRSTWLSRTVSGPVEICFNPANGQCAILARNNEALRFYVIRIDLKAWSD